MSIVTAFIMIMFGLITCFLGKRLLKWILGVQAFAITFYLVVRIMIAMDQHELLTLIVALLIATGVGFLAHNFLDEWVFMVLGVYLGLVIVGSIELALGMQGIFVLFLLILGALVGGVIGHHFSSPIIKISTSFSGAAQTITGFSILSTAIGLTIPVADPFVDTVVSGIAGLISIFATLVLGIIGLMFQVFKLD